MEFLFTREQYNDIINFEDFSTIFTLGLQGSIASKLYLYIVDNDLEKEAMELANPNTRELAELKYVEPEPKYTWYYVGSDRFINLYAENWYLDNDNSDSGNKSMFTEEEIDASPFKKEFFTKKK